MTVTYDPADFNEVTVLLRWRGTIMPAVLCRPVIWLLLLAHCTFLYLHVKRQDIEMPLLDWKIVAVPTGLLTFFLVFYSGNCFNRYYQLYGKCTGMAGAVMIWVGLLRLFFPRASTQTLWNLCRHAVASVYVFYFQLGGGGSDGGRVITESEWAVRRRRATLGASRRNSAQFRVIAHVLLPPRLQVLLKHNMLSEEEVQQVAVYRGFKPFLLQVWAMQTIRDYLDSGADKAAGAGIGPFQAQALALRANCSDVVNLLAQPVPFPYYHVVSFMLCVNLFGMACAAGRVSDRDGAPRICAAPAPPPHTAPPPSFLRRYALIGFNSVSTIPAFFVVCLVLLGMKETAVALSDPFGGDAVDFDCDQFMASILNNTRAMLSRGAELKPAQLPVPAMLLDAASGDYERRVGGYAA